MLETAALYALAVNFLFMLPAYRSVTTSPQLNIFTGRYQTWFARRPFTCPFCMGFWSALFGSCFILLSGGVMPLAALAIIPMCSATLTALIHRLFNHLNITL